jgi:hypothetical protein
MVKAPRKKTPARKSRGGMLIGVFIGLVLGVVLCAAVMFYINGSALPLHIREATPAPGGTGAEPAALPGKPGDKASTKPRFDFYDMLPGGQTATPAEQRDNAAALPGLAAPTTADLPPPAPAANEGLSLQAGAFSSEQEADNLRARLALMGLESSVFTFTAPGRNTLYRVRLGPYASVDEMKKVRSDLAQNGIDASIVR